MAHIQKKVDHFHIGSDGIFSFHFHSLSPHGGAGEIASSTGPGPTVLWSGRDSNPSFQVHSNRLLGQLVLPPVALTALPIRLGRRAVQEPDLVCVIVTKNETGNTEY